MLGYGISITSSLNMKKYTISLIILLTTTYSCLIMAFTPTELHSPTGYWLTIDDKSNKPRAVVQIFQVNTTKGIRLRGKTIAAFYLPHQSWRKKCTGCIKPWTDKVIKGLTFMYGYQKSGANWDAPWVNGYVFDISSSSKIYKSKIWLIDGGKKLKLRGYVLFFYRTQTWHRLTPAEVSKYIKISNEDMIKHPPA